VSTQASLTDLAFQWRHPVTRELYDKMVEHGALEDARVELLAGVLVDMSPQGRRHAEAIEWLTTELTLALARRASVRVQLPLAVSDLSVPEPDLAIVAAGPRPDHPVQAHLVIEVSETSQAKDRTLKARLYAAAGIPEYWLCDLTTRTIEVHRDPAPEGYRDIQPRAVGATVAPLTFPDIVLAVADMLPA
jgi:Uma2 family endonuclease